MSIHSHTTMLEATSAPAVATHRAGQGHARADYSFANLLYAPVEIGTIRIGGTREVRGIDVPVKHDYFRVTTLVRRDGEWIEHGLQEKLLAASQDDPETPLAERKLRSIPVRVQFDDPALSIRSRLEAFDTRKKRPVCASSGGGKAIRLEAGPDGVARREVACEGPERCELANSEGIRCKFFGRASFQIDGQADQENAFMFRSTSYNTMRNLEARLWRYRAMFGGRLSGVPFHLVLRTRTTAGSKWQPIFFLDLQLPPGASLAAAAAQAKEHAAQWAGAGLDREAYEAVIKQGLENGALSDDPIEASLMEEFFTGADVSPDPLEGVDTTERIPPEAVQVAGLMIDGIRAQKTKSGAELPPAGPDF